MSFSQYSSYRKNRRGSISLGVLVFLATMLLVSSIAIQFTISDYYEQSNERLNAAHYTISIPNNQYKNEYFEYLQNDSRVSKVDLTEMAVMNGASYEVNGGKMMLYPLVFSLDREREIFPLSIAEETTVPLDHPIYVPLFFKNNGYLLGDQVTFTYHGTAYDYHIAGYFETTWFGSSVNGMIFFYLPEEEFTQLYGQVGGGKFLAAKLYDIADVKALKKELKQDLNMHMEAAAGLAGIFDTDFYEMQAVSVIIPNIFTVIMFAFSVIIFAIIFLVIRFRIYSYVEDNMKNIGVMEAIGYTTVQIRKKLIYEYVLLAIAGAVPGMIASYGLLALMGAFISGFMGVSWQPQSYLLFKIICLVLITGTIALVTYICSRKIKNISPVMALRGTGKGLAFRKNHFSLVNKIGSLQLQLATKGLLANIRQYVMVAIILFGVSAAASYAFLLHSNMTGKHSAIYKVAGMENANVAVKTTVHQDLSEIRQEFLAMEEVRAISSYYPASCVIEDIDVTTFISDDFDKLETVNVYQGDFPRYDNEIVISGMLSRIIDKQIGDSIRVISNGVTADYIICGYTQTLNNLGIVSIMSLEGIHRMNPSYRIAEINVYLKDEYLTESFIRKLEDQYQILNPYERSGQSDLVAADRISNEAEKKIAKLLTSYGVDYVDYSLSVNGKVLFSGSSFAYQIEKVENVQLFVETSIGAFVSMVGILSTGILAVTLFIVALILFIVIRYMILKRKQEFGIMKSIGYTSKQIRFQIALGFLSISAIGIGMGCVVAAISLNQVWNFLLQPLGVSSLAFNKDPLVMLCLFAGLLIYVFGIAYLSSGKVKDITAYELFTE